MDAVSFLISRKWFLLWSLYFIHTLPSSSTTFIWEACCLIPLIWGNALPAKDKKHFGRHSYTVTRGAGKLEVLLKNRAFYVRTGDKGQISWQKNGGVKSAWIIACGKAGVLPWLWIKTGGPTWMFCFFDFIIQRYLTLKLKCYSSASKLTR